MSFTKFDPAPIRQAVQDFGGMHGLPVVQAVPVGGGQDKVADRIAGLLDGDFLSVWEVDDFCCTYLGTHPAMLYGETWWQATAPEFESAGERAEYIAQELERGVSVGKVARQLGIERSDVFRVIQARRPRKPRVYRTPTAARGNSKYSVETIRAAKADLLAGVKRSVISQKYGIHKSTLAVIARGERWAWVKVGA